MWFSAEARAGAKILRFPQRLKSRTVRDLCGLRASLGRTGSLEVRLATTKREIRKAQRLRYKVFYEEGQAQADATAALMRRDICPFDRHCDHLIVIDHAARSRLGRIKPKIIGTYRLLRQDIALAQGGFYSAREFDIAPLLARHPDKNFLELGRSCVLAAWRSRRTLDLLWRGLWAYVQHHHIDVMIGCASFAGTNPQAHAASFGFLATHAKAEADWQVRPQAGRGAPVQAFDPAMGKVRAGLAALPPLIKGYLRVGARFGDGMVVDHQFGTTDVFVVMPVADIAARYATHFGGDAGERAAA